MVARNNRLLLLSGIASLCMVTPAFAQTVPGRSVDIAAQPLSSAVAALSARSGTRVTLGDGVAGSVPVRDPGNMASVPDALNRMLAGTGLSWRQSGDVIEIIGSATVATSDEHMLGTVRVEGSRGSGNGAFADLSAFGAGAGANGSSDTTATEGTGSFTGNGARVASKTAATIRETPFTVNVVTSEQLKQQNASDIIGALNASPGITIPNSGPSLSILSRGFDISSFQTDGGPPQRFANNLNGYLSQPDISAYDHIEIVRGSNGLYGGTSEPSGTINLQRKRPLDHRQIEVDARGGQWDNYRGELDVSNPVAFDGKMRARGVAAYETKDFFYDFASFKRLNLYGIVEGDLGPDTVVRGGLRYQRQRGRGGSIFGVPFYQDGRNANLPRSTNFTSNWAFNRPDEFEQFVQLDQSLGTGWTFNLNATHTRRTIDTASPILSGSVAPDRTGLFFSYADVSRSVENETAVGASLAGTFSLLGHEQKFVVGADYNRSKYNAVQNVFNTDPVYFDIDNFNPDDLGAFPAGDPSTSAASRSFIEQYAVYGSLTLEPIDNLHLAGGTRVSWVRNGSSTNYLIASPDYTPTSDSSKYNGNVTPSAGVTYDLDRTFSLYGSYAKTFDASGSQTTTDGMLLPPEHGRSFEAGIKAAPSDGKLNASLTYFDTLEKDVSILVGSSETRHSCCYAGGGVVGSRGIDLQISGALAPNWQVNAGYSYTRTRYNDAYILAPQNVGSPLPFAQGQTPKHQVKIFTAYTLPGRLSKVTVSGNFLLESTRGSFGNSCPLEDPVTGICQVALIPFRFTQSLYAIGDLRVGYRFSSHWEVAAEIKNITDRRYFATIRDPNSSNFYGEPRKVTISARMLY